MTRLAVYWVPPEGPLARFGAGWLGWDPAGAREVARPPMPGLSVPVEEITQAPRRYGLHATLKPPFYLAPGETAEALEAAVAELAAVTPPAEAAGLIAAPLGRFLALIPEGPTAGLDALATRIVEGLDRFRAPAGAGEIARRRAAGLSPLQDAMLLRWGYPFAMEAFRFHVTLTGPLDPSDLATVEAALRPRLAPLLPRPFRLDAIAILREGADGRFRLLRRLALTG